jgi:large subunit ribosomal protein L22
MTENIAKAKLMKGKISPKKVGPVVDLIKGKSVTAAKVSLSFDGTKASKMLLKVLKSAEANAINNHKMNKDDLYISEVWVGPGPMTKSGEFAGKGNFRPILKRTSHIYVNIAERGK